MTEDLRAATAAAAIALDLAARHPQATLPCPVCAADVGAANLEKHLRKVHDLADVGDATFAQWTGVDRRMQVITLIPVGLTIAGAAVLMVGVTDNAAVQLRMGVFAVAFAVACVPAVLAFLGKFRGTLEFEGEALVHRYALGMLSRRITLPLRIEAGALHGRREGNMVKDGDGYRGPSEDIQVGSYLACIGTDGLAFIAGSKRGARLGKTWDAAGFSRGGVRRRWDLEFDAPQLTQLQYQLAARGLLTPRADE